MHTPLTIVKPAFGGFGLGFSKGKAIFVWGSIPGEIVDVQIMHETSSHAFAKIVKIHKPSLHRIEPKCSNFGLCGGCDYLQMNYEEELRIKKEIIRDSLTRIAKIKPEHIVEIEMQSSSRFGYRTHADIKFSHDGIPGFYRKESNEVIRFPEKGCMLLSDALREGITTITNNTARQCKIATDAFGLFHSSLERNSQIIEKENNITYARRINCFFQANRFLRAQMANIVSKYAQVNHKGKFIDAACGVGFFSLHLASASQNGKGYDISNESIFWAKQNALRNNILNVEFFTANFSSMPITGGEYDAVIVDPPRAGLSKKARKTIIFIAPKRLVYVSCNPATFARDAMDFMAAGYIFSRLTFIDMFPGTQHIEIIGLFEILQ